MPGGTRPGDLGGELPAEAGVWHPLLRPPQSPPPTLDVAAPRVPPAFRHMQGGVTFCKFVAYPHDFVEPLNDDKERNDGEPLLARLRTLWCLFDEPSPSRRGVDAISMAILDSHDVQDPAVKNIVNSLTNPSAESKPIVRLIAPTTMMLHYKKIESELPKEEKERTVAIHGSADRAILTVSVDELPMPLIIVRFNDETRASATRAEVEIVLEGSNIKVKVVSFTGSKKSFVLCRGDIPEGYPASLFSAAHIERFDQEHLLPKCPSQVPFRVQQRFAEFWNNDLRAAPLVVACQPTSNRSNRSLCFSSVSIFSRNVHPTSKMALSGTLHESSGACICAAHGLGPEKVANSTGTLFTNSKVNMTISMCGRPLLKMDPSPMSHGVCSLHRSMGVVDGIPDMCCYETMCDVSCGHFTSKREYKQGLSIRSIPLDDVNLLHAQILVASAIRSTNAIAPMLEKKGGDEKKYLHEIAEECKYHSSRLDHSLESVKRLKRGRTTKFSKSELASMDETTTKLLREGKTFQRWVKSKRKTIMVNPNPRTDGWSSVGPGHKSLDHFHKWQFPQFGSNR